jgi:hypothetical protein
MNAFVNIEGQPFVFFIKRELLCFNLDAFPLWKHNQKFRLKFNLSPRNHKVFLRFNKLGNILHINYIGLSYKR